VSDTSDNRWPVGEFAQRLIRWQRTHGRHDLPWQGTRDAYRVWLSEIMLQQTQVATVIPYYLRFLARFPDLASLASVPIDEVMPLWSGLGYYARARNLHACALTVLRDFGGEFPHSPEALMALPGIGRSTANSIATFCFDAGAPILDGNVKRLLCRAFGVEGHPAQAAVSERLWQLAHAHMPLADGAIYNQAQMDMGAGLCTRSRPRCGDCPVGEHCIARREDRVADLPSKKPARIKPEKQARFLIVRDDAGRVLLVRRPPAGIWGALDCLPELRDGEDVAQWLLEHAGLRLIAVSPALTWRHDFSHYRLHMEALHCRVAPTEFAVRANESSQRWLDAAALTRAALPAPMRDILMHEGVLSPTLTLTPTHTESI
jgi:A/G-specific adenine glycosylase